MTEHDSPLIPEWDDIEQADLEPLDADADEEGYDG